MPHIITREDLVEHLNLHYAEETLLVADIWSSQDVEVQLVDGDEDKAMDIWADIALEFAGAFDYTTSILNDSLYGLVEDSISNE